MATTSRISQMQQLLAGIENGSTPPYFAEYLPAPGAEAAVDIEKYPGLMFYYFVQPETPQVRIATAWRSREFYLRETERLRAALQAPPVIVHGVIARSAIPTKPFWKRQSLLTSLLAFTSVLGALEVVRNHFSSVFDPPSLTLKTEKQAELTEGSEFFEHLGLLNDLPIPHKNVKLAGTWTIGGLAVTPVVPLQVSPSAIAYMAPGAKHEIEISGVAPKHGKYEIVFNIDAKAGYLAGLRPFRFTRAVTVWPKLPVGTLGVETMQDRSTALLRGKLSVGPAAPYGLDCALELRRSTGLKYQEGLDFPGLLPDSTQWNHSSESLPGEMAILQWSVLPVAARTVIPFKVALSRSADTDWSQVAQRSTVSCYYREEKPK